MFHTQWNEETQQFWNANIKTASKTVSTVLNGIKTKLSFTGIYLISICFLAWRAKQEGGVINLVLKQ